MIKDYRKTDKKVVSLLKEVNKEVRNSDLDIKPSIRMLKKETQYINNDPNCKMRVYLFCATYPQTNLVYHFWGSADEILTFRENYFNRHIAKAVKNVEGVVKVKEQYKKISSTI